MKTKYASCKLLGHAWEPFTPVEKWRGVFHNVLHLVCTRCLTERHDSFDSMGNLAQRKYSYPDGYKDSQDERPTRAELRLQFCKKGRR